MEFLVVYVGWFLYFFVIFCSRSTHGYLLKNLLDDLDSDIICLQEMKIQTSMVDESIAKPENWTGYAELCNTTAFGSPTCYSGVATFIRNKTNMFNIDFALGGFLPFMNNMLSIYPSLEEFVEIDCELSPPLPIFNHKLPSSCPTRWNVEVDPDEKAFLGYPSLPGPPPLFQKVSLRRLESEGRLLTLLLSRPIKSNVSSSSCGDEGTFNDDLDEKEYLYILNIYAPASVASLSQTDNGNDHNGNATAQPASMLEQNTKAHERLNIKIAFQMLIFALSAVLNKNRTLHKSKLVIAGDFNVSPRYEDSSAQHTAKNQFDNFEGDKRGVMISEYHRMWLALLKSSLGLVDSYIHVKQRMLLDEKNKDEDDCIQKQLGGRFSCWNQSNGARLTDSGSRIDLILVQQQSKQIVSPSSLCQYNPDSIAHAGILSSFQGSDHAPIFATLVSRRTDFVPPSSPTSTCHPSALLLLSVGKFTQTAITCHLSDSRLPIKRDIRSLLSQNFFTNKSPSRKQSERSKLQPSCGMEKWVTRSKDMKGGVIDLDSSSSSDLEVDDITEADIANDSNHIQHDNVTEHTTTTMKSIQNLSPSFRLASSVPQQVDEDVTSFTTPELPAQRSLTLNPSRYPPLPSAELTYLSLSIKSKYLHDAASAPGCLHGFAAMLRTVRQPGKNLGKSFWGCGKGVGGKCNFFLWGSEWNKGKMNEWVVKQSTTKKL